MDGANRHYESILDTNPLRVAHLDGLRGIAVLLIVLHHFIVPLFNGPPGSLQAYAAASLSLTFAGVDLFFVLSGYLIGGILFDNRSSPRLFTTFYVRRAARILPLAFMFVGFCFAAYRNCWFSSTVEGPLFPSWVYLLFVSNFWSAALGEWGFRPLSLLWSLAIEEQFYLVAPFAICWLRPATAPRVLILAIVLAPLFRIVMCAFGDAGKFATHFLPFCRMDALALGVLVAWLMRQPEWSAALRERYVWLVGATAALGVSLMLLTKWRVAPGSLALATWGYSAIAFACAGGLLLLELFPRSLVARLLSLFPLTLIGRLSYFAYLFQTLVVGVAVSLFFSGRFAVANPDTTGQLAVGVVTLFLTAWASWQFVESPILSMARRFRY
jgi:peptidoglycan/LPS O-acetylase OafA/YrhL